MEDQDFGQGNAERSNRGGSKTIDDLPDEILLEVFSYLGLEDLVLHLRHVSGRWMALSEDNRLFRDLRYRPHSDTDVKHIEMILQLAPKLRWLSMSYISSVIVRALCNYCRDIRCMNLNRDTIDMLSIAVKHCPDVEDFGLYGDLGDSMHWLASLSGWQQLKTLRIHWSKDTKGVLAIAAECTHLESLELVDCGNYDDLSCFLERKGAHLQRLYLWCCWSGKCLFPLVKQHCTRLRDLHLVCYMGSAESLVQFFTSTAAIELRKLEIMDQKIDELLGASILEKCHHLTSLILINVDIEDESLCFIHKLKNLQHLVLHCYKLTDVGVRYITCSELRHLNLKSAEITEQGFLHCLHTLPYLRKLLVEDTILSPASLLKIPQFLKHLKHLTVRANNLEETVPVIQRKLPDLEIMFEEGPY